MVPANILQRTLKIKYNERIGTCFTLDIENKQYVITARHIVQGIAKNDEIEVYQNSQWNKLPVKLVGLGENGIDIAVMALPQQLPLSPPPLIPVKDAGLFLSQDIYFLGFPYGLQTDVSPEINLSFPLPLVKKGIISSFKWDNGKISYMLLDGHNNPGFSGGPVFCPPLGNGTQESKQVGVIGVISSYLYTWEKTFKGQTTESELIGYYQSNTGIILAYSINHAISIIHRNPIGFNLG